MQVEAIYENGKVRFITPVRLKNHAIRMRIDIPDEEIEQNLEEEKRMVNQPDIRHTEMTFVGELQAILEPVKEQLKSSANQPLSKAEVREIMGDAWEEKHRG